MSKSIRFFDFHGITPRLDETLLNSAGAMVAEDVDLSRGDLMPWKWATEPKATRTQPVLTMVDSEASCGCITWPEVVDVDFGQPACSDIGMMFWIENGVVMQATREQACQGLSFPLGVSCPSIPPSGGSSTGGEGCITVESYCYTYVDQYGQEGPPSPPSAISTGGSGSAAVTIPGLPAPNPQARVNVYRATADGSTGRENNLGPDGAWLRVGEGLTGTTITTRPLNQAAETLRSTRWAPPPTGITSLQICPRSNTLMLAKDNQIFISHPNQYHAFPRDRDLVLQDNVVALQDYAESMVVLTDGHPYVVVPRALRERAFIYDVSRLDTSIPCLSKASVSVGASGVIWSSQNGLFIISNGRYGIRATCLTMQLFHMDDWRESLPSTIRGEVHDGHYFFTGDGEVTCSITGHQSHTWILTFNDEIYEHPSNIQMTSLSIRPLMWHQTRMDKLYYSLGNEVFEWNPIDGELKPYCYTTRDTVLRGLTTLGAAKVHHDCEAVVNISFHKEKCTKVHSIYRRKLSHCDPFRLPGCLKSIHQYVKVTSINRVRSIHLATSVRDLTNHSDSTFDHGNTRLTSRSR